MAASDKAQKVKTIQYLLVLFTKVRKFPDAFNQ